MSRPSAKGFSQLSSKHLAVDKANSKVIIAAAAATALLVFSLFASNALIGMISYQNEVITKRQEANRQLENNIDSIDKLNASFIAFDSSAESAIGTPEKNSKITLDALPSKYDFPALTSSIESIISGAGLSIQEITGTDQEATAEQSSINPNPIEIPFEVTATGTYESVQRLITDFERSIRPFYIISIELSGEDTNLKVSISAKTFYQPTTEIGITDKVVKTDTSSKKSKSTEAKK